MAGSELETITLDHTIRGGGAMRELRTYLRRVPYIGLVASAADGLDGYLNNPQAPVQQRLEDAVGKMVGGVFHSATLGLFDASPAGETPEQLAALRNGPRQP